MKKLFLTSLASSLILIFATSAAAENRKLYSQEENDKLVYCIALSDIAFHVAQRKIDGVKIDAVKKEYTSATDPIVDELIAKVYREQVSSALDYQRAFFHNCGISIAKISESRMKEADFCNRSQFLAGVIFAQKESGKTREQTKKTLNIKPGSFQATIVDAVYNTEGSRTDIKLGMWNSCVQSIEQ